MTLNKMVAGIAIAVVSLIMLLSTVDEARANTYQSYEEACSVVGNLAMTVAELRDQNIPLSIAVDGLGEIGLKREAAIQLTTFIYSNPDFSQERLGNYFFKYCMINAGEEILG